MEIKINQTNSFMFAIIINGYITMVVTNKSIKVSKRIPFNGVLIDTIIDGVFYYEDETSEDERTFGNEFNLYTISITKVLSNEGNRYIVSSLDDNNNCTVFCSITFNSIARSLNIKFHRQYGSNCPFPIADGVLMLKRT